MHRGPGTVLRLVLLLVTIAAADDAADCATGDAVTGIPACTRIIEDAEP